MFSIEELIKGLPLSLVGSYQSAPWRIVGELPEILKEMVRQLNAECVTHNNVAIHRTATIETGAIIKGPAIIGPNCFVGANAYLRNGVYLGNEVVIGPGCEVKTSIIMTGTHLAHFNFVGDSIVGTEVNFEAGAVICNHWNEKKGKQIKLLYQSEIIETGIEKFGAIIGDYCKVGANAVLSPGTILAKNTVVKRLELVEQIKSN
jgi:NDP-sugar pyrophosphorylase family protein